MQRPDIQEFESLLGPLDQGADWDLIHQRVRNLCLSGGAGHDLRTLREKMLRAPDRGILLAAVRALLGTGELSSWRLVFEAMRDLDGAPPFMNLGSDIFAIVREMIHISPIPVRPLLEQLSSDGDALIADEAQQMIDDLGERLPDESS